MNDQEPVRYFGDDPCESLSHFVGIMGRKLAANSHKTGWRHNTPGELIGRLKQELKELERAIKLGKDEVTIQEEAADVANFAMMIADLHWGRNGHEIED